MVDRARRRLTPDEFYHWLSTQHDARFELVDGEPVLRAGATRRHDLIVMNASRILTGHLRGKPCRPFSAETYIRIPIGNRRQPDLGIDGGKFDDRSLEAAEPVLVVEVLSPSTRVFDCNDKLEEYRSVGSIEYILLIDPDAPLVRLYSRAADGTWLNERIAGLSASIPIPRFDLKIVLGDLYEGLEFRPRPALVDPTDGSRITI